MAKKEDILPQEIRSFLKNVLYKMFGVFLILLSLSGFLFLSAYNPADGSLNTATLSDTLNIGGSAGS